MAVDLDGQRGLLKFFLVLLVLGGHVCIPLVLFTILFSRRVVRHPIFINFVGTWVLYSLSYSLLLYAGQTENLKPHFGTCLTQAAMVYASPPMVGLSSLYLVIHIHLTLRAVVYQTAPPRWQTLGTVAMILTPYVVYIIVFIVFFAFGNNNPQLVYRSVFYCTMRSPVLTSLGPGIAALALLISLGINVRTGMLLRLHWQVFRRSGQNSGLGLSFLVRALVFTFCAIISIVVCIAFFTELLSPAPNLVIAFLPLAVFLTFGTQTVSILAFSESAGFPNSNHANIKDLVREWMFKREKQNEARNENFHPRYKNQETDDIAVHTPLTAKHHGV